LLALFSRLFPHAFSTRQIGVFLPNAAARLSFPLGYWNGLAILTGLGVPLCVRTALVARRPSVRAVAVGLVPALVAVIYLTSSRGGAATAAVGTIVFIAATARRWPAAGATLAGAAGSLLAVAVLATRHTLVNGPVGSALAASQGRVAAVLLVGCGVLSAALLPAGERLVAPRFRPPRRFARVAPIVLALAVVAVAALSHPVRRFDAFTRVPTPEKLSASNFASAHLLSRNGSGRWQWWASAVHEFEHAPLVGKGAGSFQFWWAAHATFRYSLKNAHSLYLETLGELGIVGFLLVIGAFAVGLATAVARVRGAAADTRVTVAALAGVLSAFVVGAAIDWIWQLTVIAVVGVAALALLVGPATASPTRAVVRTAPPARGSRIALAVGGLAVAWALICAQAIPWLAAQRLAGSQAAARQGDLGQAASKALDAKRLEPWAASPYLQLALVAEAQGSFASARRWIHDATARDAEDWSVWYIASRIEHRSGRITVGREDYAKAASLNPRSPVFAPADGP
jgi:O-antigen ligase